MAEEVKEIKETKEVSVKTIALEPKTHAKIVAIKKELNIRKMNDVIDKLATEYEQNRK